MRHYVKGRTVYMTDNALDNYGEQWRGIALVVTHAAHSYMPAQEFYAKGRPEGFHPGYDNGAKGQHLYDLKVKDTGEDLPYSLYDWELQPHNNA